MRRKLAVVLAALVALAGPALADITLRPGISFVGSYIPAVTLETFVQDSLSAKFFFATGDEPSFIVSLRQWPELASLDWNGGTALPVYLGIGVVTKGADGQYIAGLYAEVGFRFAQMFDVGFSVQQAGPIGEISVNLGISFDFTVPSEGG